MGFRHFLRGSCSELLIGAAIGILPGVAWAQDTVRGSQDDGVAGGMAFDEVIVTANRREERLEDVPVAIAVVSGATLEKASFNDAKDLQYLVPSLTFSGTTEVSSGGGYQLRGIGTQAFNYGTEQTVGLMVDGVLLGLPRDPGVTGFMDIESVEVLRGPQGTLFGKNTSAGVIQILTRKPIVGETESQLRLAFGSRDEIIANANVNLGLSDSSALRLSGFYSNQDGAIPNVLNDFHINDHRNRGIRAKFLWKPLDDLSVLLIGESQDSYRQQGYTVRSFGPDPVYRSYFASFPTQPSADNFIAFNEKPWFAKYKLHAGSAEINYTIHNHTLTSISAYRSLKLDQTADTDATPANIFSFSQALNDDHQFTQEIRLTSPAGEALEYVVGAYYFDSKVKADETGYGTFGLNFGLVSFSGGTNNYEVATKSTALFGQGTLRLIDDLKVIAGLRYTHDDVDASIGLTRLPFVFPLGLTRPSQGAIRNDNVSGRIGLQYELTPDVMTYLTYARGYKGPAIDLIQGRARSVRPEKVNSYEIGLKSVLLDRRAVLNVSAYWTDVLDFQAQAFDYDLRPVAITLVNAGKLRSRGAEVDASFRVTPEITLSGYGSYIDARFLEYVGACYPGQPLSGVSGQGCYVDPATNVRVANLGGERLPNAPKWSYGVQAAYDRPIAGKYQLGASANWSWRSSTFNAVADPLTKLDSYGVLNGTVRFGAEDQTWAVGVYGRNLLDKHYAAVGRNFFNSGGLVQVLAPDAFRTVGVTLDFRF